jgi:SAM-dependent methyltransferase
MLRTPRLQWLRDRTPPPVKRLLKYRGSPQEQWIRTVMNADVEREFALLGPSELSVAEVSGDSWGHLSWKERRVLWHEEFDLCDPPHLTDNFDLVICEQVLEHVPDPLTAVATLRSMLRPDGRLLVSTPFLVPLHHHPGDYWRFTPDGMATLLRARGLEPVWVRSWGNRQAIRSTFRAWVARKPWHRMHNDPTLPVVVWAMARRAGPADASSDARNS